MNLISLRIAILVDQAVHHLSGESVIVIVQEAVKVDITVDPEIDHIVVQVHDLDREVVHDPTLEVEVQVEMEALRKDLGHRLEKESIVDQVVDHIVLDLGIGKSECITEW